MTNSESYKKQRVSKINPVSITSKGSIYLKADCRNQLFYIPPKFSIFPKSYKILEGSVQVNPKI